MRVRGVKGEKVRGRGEEREEMVAGRRQRRRGRRARGLMLGVVGWTCVVCVVLAGDRLCDRLTSWQGWDVGGGR